jgi:uncharacterized protein (DUF697 family)
MRCPYCGEQNPERATFCRHCGKVIGSMRNTVLIYALVGTGLALVTGPIPGSSILLLALDVIMVYHIAKRYGIHLALTEIGCATIGVVALGTALKAFLSTVFEFIPVVGWWVGKPLVIFLGLCVLGYLADRYFHDRQVMQVQRPKA